MKKYLLPILISFFLSIGLFALIPQQQMANAAGGTGAVCTGVGTQGSCDKGLICHAPNLNNPATVSLCAKTKGKALACQNQCGVPSTGEICTGNGQGNCGTGLFCVSPISNPSLDKACLVAIQQHQPLPAMCQSKCQLPAQQGGNCTGTGQGNCMANLVCLNDVCSKVPSGGKCKTGQCAGGLTCIKGICKSTPGFCITGPTINNGSQQGSCPSGETCQGYNPAECARFAPEGCGKCVAAAGVTGPTPLPSPPLPPCKTWGPGGVCNFFNSPFGGFSTNLNGFIQKIFAVLLSVSGGIALLLIIKAGYQLMTAQGNPEKLNNGREQLVAAIVGLVFLIFSFVFLELIGFDILQIPGFGGGTGGAGNGNGGAGNTLGKGAPCQVFLNKCANGLTCQPANAGGTNGTCQ